MSAEDEKWMHKALRLAKVAALRGEAPVGCIITTDEREIIGIANEIESRQDATAHAEILAIQAASRLLERRRLSDCSIYITLEPCPMCTGAILQARFKKVVFGAYDPKWGACGSVIDMTRPNLFNHNPIWIGGVKEDEARQLLQEFFRGLREK